MINNENDPELNGKYLGTISSDFVKISDTLKEAAYQVRQRKFSEYPIFPISKEEQPIGQLFLSRKEKSIDWNYYITFCTFLIPMNKECTKIHSRHGLKMRPALSF